MTVKEIIDKITDETGFCIYNIAESKMYDMLVQNGSCVKVNDDFPDCLMSADVIELFNEIDSIYFGDEEFIDLPITNITICEEVLLTNRGDTI